jgi:hypothetical protein
MPAEAPELIHFIWVGGPIPAEYLESIHKLQLLLQTNNQHFIKICLWTDNPENIKATSAKNQGTDLLAGISIKTVAEDLLPAMEQDSFYNKDKSAKQRLQIFKSVLGLESVGSSNFATIADLLRLEILRQHGGLYLDCDTTFECNFSHDPIAQAIPFEYTPEELPLGFKAYARAMYNCDRTSNKVKVDSIQLSFSINDMLLALPHSGIICEALSTFLKVFDKMHKDMLATGENKTKNTGKNKLQRSMYELKRSKLKADAVFKRMITIRLGPQIVCDTMQDSIKNIISKKAAVDGLFSHKDFKQITKELLLERVDIKDLDVKTDGIYISRIFGILMTSRSDQNWLQPAEGRPRSYSV